MRAVATDRLPTDESRWAFELKWDGVRSLAFVDDSGVRLQSRNLLDITPQYPELGELADATGGHRVVLDGEIVAYDEGGRPSFERLQQRINIAGAVRIQRRMAEIGVHYVAFDLLRLDDRSLVELPYADRRRLLQDTVRPQGRVQVPAYHVGDGAALLEATRRQGLEGLVAKRLDSAYEAGRRSRCWLKVKNVRRQELVIGGWLPGEGSRSGRLGSLLVGYYEDAQLRYAGRVGSGLSEADLGRIGQALAGLGRPDSPFAATPPLPPPVRRSARFVEPSLVAEVAFAEWTRSGTLRAPRFKGLRSDRIATDVGREP